MLWWVENAPTDQTATHEAPSQRLVVHGDLDLFGLGSARGASAVVTDDVTTRTHNLSPDMPVDCASSIDHVRTARPTDSLLNWADTASCTRDMAAASLSASLS